jgi:hypothetical protein
MKYKITQQSSLIIFVFFSFALVIVSQNANNNKHTNLRGSTIVEVTVFVGLFQSYLFSYLVFQINSFMFFLPDLVFRFFFPTDFQISNKTRKETNRS